MRKSTDNVLLCLRVCTHVGVPKQIENYQVQTIWQLESFKGSNWNLRSLLCVHLFLWIVNEDLNMLNTFLPIQYVRVLPRKIMRRQQFKYIFFSLTYFFVKIGMRSFARYAKEYEHKKWVREKTQPFVKRSTMIGEIHINSFLFV